MEYNNNSNENRMKEFFENGNKEKKESLKAEKIETENKTISEEVIKNSLNTNNIESITDDNGDNEIKEERDLKELKETKKQGKEGKKIKSNKKTTIKDIVERYLKTKNISYSQWLDTKHSELIAEMIENDVLEIKGEK